MISVCDRAISATAGQAADFSVVAHQIFHDAPEVAVSAASAGSDGVPSSSPPPLAQVTASPVDELQKEQCKAEGDMTAAVEAEACASIVEEEDKAKGNEVMPIAHAEEAEEHERKAVVVERNCTVTNVLPPVQDASAVLVPSLSVIRVRRARLLPRMPQLVTFPRPFRSMATHTARH